MNSETLTRLWNKHLPTTAMPDEAQLRNLIKVLQKADRITWEGGRTFEQNGLHIEIGNNAFVAWCEMELSTDIDLVDFKSIEEAREAAQQWLNSLVNGLLQFPED